MKTIAELHTTHLILSSQITLLRKELDFLVKIVEQGQQACTNVGQLRLLDGYWLVFNKNRTRLAKIDKKIQEEEKEMAALYRHRLIDEEKTLFSEDGLREKLSLVSNEIKILKDSFYEFIRESGSLMKSSNSGIQQQEVLRQ